MAEVKKKQEKEEEERRRVKEIRDRERREEREKRVFVPLFPKFIYLLLCSFADPQDFFFSSVLILIYFSQFARRRSAGPANARSNLATADAAPSAAATALRHHVATATVLRHHVATPQAYRLALVPGAAIGRSSAGASAALDGGGHTRNVNASVNASATGTGIGETVIVIVIVTVNANAIGVIETVIGRGTGIELVAHRRHPGRGEEVGREV